MKWMSEPLIFLDYKGFLFFPFDSLISQVHCTGRLRLYFTVLSSAPLFLEQIFETVKVLEVSLKLPHLSHSLCTG